MSKRIFLITCMLVIFTLTIGCAGAPDGTEKPVLKEKEKAVAEKPAEKQTEKKEASAPKTKPAAVVKTDHKQHTAPEGNRMPLGGGITKAGFTGEYFANTDFSGEPVFVRQDVRINHDWKEGEAGKGLPVGGATTPGMKDFPIDDFSIRWTGQIVPRFTETYTICVTGRDGVRFKLGNKVLVDSLDKGVVTDVTVDMKKGNKYDVVFEYVDRTGTGASAAKLMWSSPSVPWEVVEPLSFAQICGHQAAPQTWLVKERADLKREAGHRNMRSLAGLDMSANQFWKKAKRVTDSDVDNDGWPVITDFLIEVPFQYSGIHMVRFKGKADVTVGDFWFGSRIISVWNTKGDGTGESFDKDNSKGLGGMPKLPKGTGYDSETNTTTAWFDLKGNRGIMFMFADAERPDGKPGITGLEVLGPVSEGSKEHHQPGEIRKREARKVFDSFMCDRLHIGSSQNKGWKWEERTLPTYHCREHSKGWAYCLEEYIMMINEAGMDWHICCGAGWDEDFMKKFALMTKYGSDGVNPYTTYTENPKYPPLNPNLRIYLEHSNELPWAVYPRFIWDDLRKKYSEKHSDTAIINYDGKAASANGTAMFRYHALRMKQISDAFRSVYKDEMGKRARVYCFGQYTAAHMNNMLQFLDNYFNKADPASPYEGEPHPPSYYIWGGGGAIYYGCNNKFGIMEEELMTNGSFEDVAVPEGAAQLRPADAGWTFTGNAGICSVKVKSVEAVKAESIPAEPAEAPAKQTLVGFKFKVGDKGLYVYKLGRWISKDHHETNFWKRRDVYSMAIYDDKGARMASFYGGPKLAIFKPDQYAYWWCAEKAWGKGKFLPAYLEPGKTYYLVSSEPGGKAKDRFFGPVNVTAAEGITVEAAVMGKPKKWDEKPGSIAYGPVNMIFATEELSTAEGNVGVPPDCSEEVFYPGWSPKPRNTFFKFGKQCAFLQGESSMSRDFEVKEAGAYWITFNPCLDRLSNGYKKQGWGGWTCGGGGTVRVKIDDKDVTTKKLLPGGGYESRMKVFHYASTEMIKLEPGTHTVTFERVKPGKGTMFIDEIHLSNEMAFYGGKDSPNFPSGGNAFGQNAATGYHLTAQAECEMAYNWGLVPCTYEGGWAVQGDFDHYSMLAWNDLRYGSENSDEELTKQALRNAFDIWCQKGGFIYAYFYPVQKEISQFDAPLLECVQEMNDRLSAAPEAGTILPGELTPALSHSEGGAVTGYRTSWSKAKKVPEELPAWGWKSWVVTSNETKEWTITLTAAGGKCELRIDDMIKASGAAEDTLTCTVKLVAGVHTIKVRALDKQLIIEKVVVGN